MMTVPFTSRWKDQPIFQSIRNFNFDEWNVNNGVYIMTGSQPPPVRLRWNHYNQVFDDFAFEVSVKQTQGVQTNAAGIIFRNSVTISSRYEFLISVHGAYMVNMWAGCSPRWFPGPRTIGFSKVTIVGTDLGLSVSDH